MSRNGLYGETGVIIFLIGFLDWSFYMRFMHTALKWME